MSNELIEQGLPINVPVLVISLILTVFAYGAFPFIFAKTRNAPITKKKYKLLCYGINAAVMCMFCVISCGISIPPYILWTWVFSTYGIKILSSRRIMIDGDFFLDDPNLVVECQSCGYREENDFNTCPKCGKRKKRYVHLNEEGTVNVDKISFCRNCGEKLVDSSKFCRKCGTEIVEVPDAIITELENSEYCKKCGADITNDIDVCHVCGEKKGNDQ